MFLVIGALDALLTGVLFLSGNVDVGLWVGFAVRFVLWVVLPLAFFFAMFDDNPESPPPGR